MARKKTRKQKRAKTPKRSIVFGVNDPVTRKGWIILAVLCVFGTVKGMQIDGDRVGYKMYLGMAFLFFYVIDIIESFFCEPPTTVGKAGRWVRTFVPLVLFIIIYFTIYNFQTFHVSLLVLSIVFGLVVWVQLVSPVEGFHFAYVVVIIILGSYLALLASDYDPKVQPFWFCFLSIFFIQFVIYGLNCPCDGIVFFSFY
ncbi:unnamed protein product [Eruca vesicaria subsp. sativa]|uniref:Uncharacterized protein n=1 Tax=Eruca vesicaria subsp. sativa TaxID=29727 RepID=A0ABC8K4K9_ERUVS|nr:unnamed protein product [Eruca vesicaria subsp. sativa]